MAFFIVLGLLILAAFIIVVLQRAKNRVGSAWAVALVASTLAWLWLFILRLFLPLDMALISWQPIALLNGSLALRLDYFSWPYAIAVLTLCVANIFTETTIASIERSSNRWVASLTITALTILSLASANPLTLSISWSLIDISELFYHVRSADPQQNKGGLMRTFAMRVMSNFALVLATAVAWQIQPNFNLTDIPAPAGIFFLLAAGLRLGVLPIHLPFTKSDGEETPGNFLFDLAPVVSALVLIAQLPADFLNVNKTLLVIIQVLSAIAMLYASMMWISRKTEAAGRPYWIIALSAFALQCALNGNPASSRVWGLALLLSGGLLFAFNPPIRRIRFIPALGLVGLLGLPYTLLASGWQGALGTNFNVISILVLISHSLLVLGYIRYIFEASGAVTGLEKHARYTYPMGLIIIFQTILLLGLIAWPGVLTLGVWWAGLASLALSSLAILARQVTGITDLAQDLPDKLPFYRIISPIIRFIRRFFSLNWFYTAALWLYQKLYRLENFGSNVIEGEGGLLWSIVFLLIIMLLFVTRAGLS